MLGAIDRSRFEVIPVGITSEGAFTLQPDDAGLFALNPSEMPRIVDNGTRVYWPDSVATRELTVRDTDGTMRALGPVDVVFPILHGPWGEDGTVQGLLDLTGLPYVGSGVLASALGMDKHYTKSVLRQDGVPVVPWVTVTEIEWKRDPPAVRRAIEELGMPVFVKPARAGSSVGVSKAGTEAEVDTAIATAFAEDDKILVESAVSGREVEIGVLGGRAGEPSRASVAGEIVLNDREFYDFAAKYLDAPGIELVCPAELSADQLETMRSLAVRAFDAIGGEGLARVDFFLTDEDGFLVNEINTMPGFTPISMFPKCWEASGLDYPSLITELIDIALSRTKRTT